jgi:hypothetical protein
MELANFEAELSELTQLSHSAFLYDSRKEISQSYIDQRKREIEKHLEIIKQQLK